MNGRVNRSCFRWPKRKAWLAVGGSGLLVSGLVLGLCAFLRIHRLADLDAYTGMAAECHPIWKEFAFRRFGRGDSALDLLRRFPPTRREEFGRYAIYSFTTGTSNELAWTGFTVVTRDGKLIDAAAGSCTWQFSFFSTADPELDRQYEDYQTQRRHKLMRMRLEKLEVQLQKFYAQYDRWPTNDPEFYWFISGKTPPVPVGPGEKRFNNQTNRENSPAIFLEVILKPARDGAITIASVQAPDLQKTVTAPHRHPAQDSSPRR